MTNSYSSTVNLLWVSLLLTMACAGCTDPTAREAKDEAPPADVPGPVEVVEPANLLPLPEFADCDSATPPTLPPMWGATAVMQSFFRNEIVFGNLLYDESAQAFLFQLKSRYGLDVKFLVTKDRRLYRLDGEIGRPASTCTLLRGPGQSPFTVPPRQWVGSGGRCVGKAPILAKDQEWWKNPSGDVGANWFWFNVEDRLPFRSMYYADAPPSTPVPIYEHFTFNYFPEFFEAVETILPELVRQCETSTDIAEATEEYAAYSIEPLFKTSTYPQISFDHVAGVQQWIPGLSECFSVDDLPPQWPNRVQGTVFMTAVSFEPNPFPTRLFYDFLHSPPAQNTTLYTYPTDAEKYSQTALLTGNTGYIYFSKEDGTVTSCHQALPGPQVPNWQQVDGCECRAELAPKSPLNPTDVPTKILWCPTDLAAKQVFWTWYSETGTPVVFMQSNSSPTDGTGLNLADYYQWEPGSVAPTGAFSLPAICGAPKKDVPQACHNCHLPTNAREKGTGT